jgi:hypothetical protein
VARRELGEDSAMARHGLEQRAAHAAREHRGGEPAFLGADVDEETFAHVSGENADQLDLEVLSEVGPWERGSRVSAGACDSWKSTGEK